MILPDDAILDTHQKRNRWCQ